MRLHSDLEPLAPRDPGVRRKLQVRVRWHFLNPGDSQAGCERRQKTQKPKKKPKEKTPNSKKQKRKFVLSLTICRLGVQRKDKGGLKGKVFLKAGSLDCWGGGGVQN